MNHTPIPWVRQGQGILNHPVTGAPVILERIETSLGLIEIHDMTNEPEGNFNLLLLAPKLVEALDRLVLAAQHRDNTMGDPSRLIETTAELRAATKHGLELLFQLNQQ